MLGTDVGRRLCISGKKLFRRVILLQDNEKSTWKKELPVNKGDWKDSPLGLIVLGLEMLLICFGATVLVPLMTGINVSIVLFSAGVATIFFHFLTKYKSTNGAVPIFLGSSFAYLPAIFGAQSEGYGMPAIFFGLACAGLGKIIFSRVIKIWGSDLIKKTLFPPVVVGSIIAVIGLNLVPVGVGMARGDADARSARKYAVEVAEGRRLSSSQQSLLCAQVSQAGYLSKAEVAAIPAFERDQYLSRLVLEDPDGYFSMNCYAGLFAVITLLVAVVVMTCLRGVIRLLPVIIGVAAGYVLVLIFGRVDFAPFHQAAWFSFPEFTAIEVDFSAAFFILPFVVGPVVEHFGDIMAVGSAVEKDFFQSPGVDRTMLGDGIGTLFGGLIGSVPNTSYSEGVSALNILRIKNPKVMLIAGIFAVLLSFVQKIAGLLQTIPTCVLGGIMVVIFGGIAVIGLSTYVREKVDFSNARNIVIAAIMLVVGIGNVSFEWGQFKLSGIGLAAVLGVLLNLVLPHRLPEDE